jgi:polysaccharide export outer membrane protein
MKQAHRTPCFRLLSRGLLALVLACLAAVGCARVPQTRMVSPDSSTASPTVTQINSALASMAMQTPGPSPDYHLGAEDVLQITLFNVPEQEAGVTPRKTEVRVSQQGIITLPLLGDLSVTGLTASGLEEVLRQRYSKFIHNPQVGVYVKEYRGQQIAVLGAVKSPNVYQLTGPKTLVDLLSMAGGINERAGTQVHIYRQKPDGRQTYIVDLLALSNNPSLVNMPVQAGDVINVPQAGMFFVEGAVGRPGSYPFNRPHTLTQALAVAGGVTETLADYSNVAIFRRRDMMTEADRLSINLKEILAGQAVDPPIEADDVIVVPMSTAKYIIERFIGTIGLPGFPGIR